MKKFLYIMPAVLICMLYALLIALAGGIGGFQPIAFAYIRAIKATIFVKSLSSTPILSRVCSEAPCTGRLRMSFAAC